MNKQPLVGVFLAFMSMIFATLACLNGYGLHELVDIDVDSGPREFIFENGETYLWGITNLNDNQIYEITVSEKQPIYSSGVLTVSTDMSAENLKRCPACMTHNSGSVAESGLTLMFISYGSGHQVRGTFSWADKTIKTATYIVEMRTVTK